MKTVCDAAERYYAVPPPAEVLDPVVQRIKRLDSPDAGKFSAALQRMDTVLTVPTVMNCANSISHFRKTLDGVQRPSADDGWRCPRCSQQPDRQGQKSDRSMAPCGKRCAQTSTEPHPRHRKPDGIPRLCQQDTEVWNGIWIHGKDPAFLGVSATFPPRRR